MNIFEDNMRQEIDRIRSSVPRPEYRVKDIRLSAFSNITVTCDVELS